MDILSKLKFWANSMAAAGFDGSSDGDSFTISSRNSNTNEDETEDDDSFFDLVFKSPEKCFIKELQFIESPAHVVLKEKSVSPGPNPKPQSAPKLKVFMFRFKKPSKRDKTDNNSEKSKRDSKSLTGDNSLRSKLLGETCDESSTYLPSKQSSKALVPKYVKVIKPLHVKASKRKNWIMNFSDSVIPTSSPASASNPSPLKLNFVNKHLTKSRSASSAVGVPALPPLKRRDDSLMEQHDGIQGAILHCKQCFSSSSGMSSLSRSASYSSHDKVDGTSLHEERKRCSI